MTQNESGGIVALTAQTQQILGEAMRPDEFAAVQVIERLPIGCPKELRRGTELLPQLSCTGIGLPRLRRGVATKTAPRAPRNSSSCRWRSGVSGNSARWSKPL